MMDLDSAIQHCKEQVQEQAKKGCYSCAEEHQQLAEWLKELKAYKEQSGDAISRQMAIDALKDIKDLQGRNIFAKKGLFPWNVIAQLPSATPQQRTGRWIKDEHENGVPYIWVCSNCGTYHRAMYDYCPSCGTKMEV